MATRAASAAGITTRLQIGMAMTLASIANACVLWKW
jgi:hypothetical protein